MNIYHLEDLMLYYNNVIHLMCVAFFSSIVLNFCLDHGIGNDNAVTSLRIDSSYIDSSHIWFAKYMLCVKNTSSFIDRLK